MKEATAKKLLVAVKADWSLYVEDRLDTLRKAIEIASDINEIFKLQGQIKEVKRLLTVREEVEAILRK